jgi:hypothetical protein
MALSACGPGLSAPAPQAADPLLGSVPPEVVGSEGDGVNAPASESIFELIGTIERMAPAAWTINGLVLAILPETEIHGSFRVGELAKVHAVLTLEGSLAAREIDPVQARDPATLAGAEFDFSGTVEAMAVDEWTVGGTTFAVTPQTEIKALFDIGDLARVHLMVLADGALVAREIEATDAILDDASAGDEVEFVGFIDSIATDHWVVGGRTLAITPQTEIMGTFDLGDPVKVHAIVGSGGNLTAREIEPADIGDDGPIGDDDNGDDNGNDNGDDNSNDNGDDNSNDNGDDNSNDNGDDNSNDNGDDNGNDNGDDNGNDNS